MDVGVSKNVLFPALFTNKGNFVCCRGYSDLAVFQALFTGVMYYVALYFIYLSKAEFLLNILMYIICPYHQ